MKVREAANETPALIVIFGITGDLAARKLLPALYHLTRDNLLLPDTKVVGVTRQPLTKDEVLVPLEQFVQSHTRPSVTALQRFKANFELLQTNIADESGYRQLGKFLTKLEGGRRYQRLYYLSIPPAVFDEVVHLMGEAGLHKARRGQPRPALLIEKPFGYDLQSAEGLIASARHYFTETQLYRIDHYLAKEMAQNILDFRMHNPLFRAVWNHHHIDKVVITAHEKIGIEGRVNFYERTGALRDLIQSHLLQLMALAAMELPARLTAGSIRKRRYELLRAVKVVEPYEVAEVARRGQYATYRTEVGNEHSATETYASLQLYIQSRRWAGTPFYLRTGKATSEKRTDIAIYFGNNILTLELQPEETIHLRLHGKKPGHGHETDEGIMDFSYKRTFPGLSSPEAYERVLLDAIHHDQTLFASSREVVEAWRIVQPVLSEWAKSDSGLVLYPAGQVPYPEP